MSVKLGIVDDGRTAQLRWFGHLQRMNQDRVPKKALRRTPQGRRRGIPGTSWREGINGEMQRGLADEI